MSKPIPSPRTLQPVADYFPHQGAPRARLSPTKSLKNAAIIYESIKNLPDKTLVRGDFDKRSHPYIFFPERAKKKIGFGGNLNPVEAKNIEAGRKEMGNFLSSIVIESSNYKNLDPKVASAAKTLRENTVSNLNDRCDFTVGDIKKPLSILANAYHVNEVRKITSPHRLLGREVTRIQNKRLREFLAISRETIDDIYEALGKNYLKKYDVRPEMGLFAIKVMVRQFLDQESVSSKSFASFVRQHANDPDIKFFAQRWVAISQPMPSDERIQFSTEPWAKELDRICDIIVKSDRRSTRLLTVHPADGGDTGVKVVLQGSATKLPSLTPRTDKVVYSSLKSEDTDESSSFPNSPYQPKSSSSGVVHAAPLYTSEASVSAHYSTEILPPGQRLFGLMSQASEEEFADSDTDAQSTPSPIQPERTDNIGAQNSFTGSENKIGAELYSPLQVSASPRDDYFDFSPGEVSPANEKKVSVSLGQRFKSQLSAVSRGILPVSEADENVQRSEQAPLLNNSGEGSDNLAESSDAEEKM